jgi:hypothetical protein
MRTYVFIGSKFLFYFIEVRTDLPYQNGARVVWFSPAKDYDLHQIDLGSGAVSFAIDKTAQITVAVDGAQPITTRNRPVELESVGWLR